MLTDKEQEEIRRKLLGLEEEPPADGWSRISADIKPANKPRPVWWLLGAALLLLLTTVGVYQLIKKEPGSGSAPLAGKYKQEEVTPGARANNSDQRSISSGSTTGETATRIPQPETPQLEDQNKIKHSESTKQLTTKEVIKRNEAPAESIVEPAKPTIVADYKPKPVPMPVAVTAKKDSVPEDEKYKQESIVAKPANYSDVSDVGLVGNVPEVQNSEAVPFPDSLLLALKPDTSLIKKPASDKETDTLNKHKEWFIDLTFSPRYAFRSFTPTTADDIYITSIKTGTKLDPERMGYEFGLNAGKMVRPKVYLETSLTAMKLRENLAYNFTNGEVDTLIKTRLSDGSYKATPVYVVGERQLKSSFVYGGLRVAVSYFFLESTRSRYNLTFGGGMNLLVKGRTRVYHNGELTETIEFPSDNNLLEQRNYNLLFGAGYNTTLHDKYELMLMPNLNYFLGSTYGEREPFGLRPYTLGLSIQVRRRFY
ncbi:hypothetical protein H8S95_03060 [Pontibacter sp. KCTC 32443]|uniref:hypothetical protein n=1 Tax=Pontibacter TaxID=323449 RepID=UPI00164EB63E|nr:MULTISPECIES: hypothetical protein [Pontibacter]MBC5773031.1 hypothetical protein [Pontibacter sp. KCTC 32443]